MGGSQGWAGNRGVAGSQGQAGNQGEAEVRTAAAAPAAAPLKEAMDAYEKSIIASALQLRGGNVSAAARDLEITRQALQHKIKKYGL